jgi:carboxypeptidase family protein/TonB-dependent receptor-like protein
MRLRVPFYPGVILLVLAGVAPPPPSLAQDFRGTIAGVVTDSQGAAVPGVAVTVTNLGTNVATTVTTDATGQYRVSYLISGRYAVKMELQGFKTVVRQPIEVRVGDVIPMDAALEAGGIEEVVEVTATTPLLNTRSGVTGQVIDSNQIQRLPLGDGTAYMLSRLVPGVSDSSDLHFSRPMDNGNMAGIVANGALGGNDFTLDGAPNRVSPNNTNAGNNSGVVGFSPPSDAIAEFQVQTNAFDAQAGQTSGAVVNLALKSGQNDFHGAFGYFNRDDSRAATPLLSERAGAAKPTRNYNRYTGTLSGPVIKNKTFFMVSYEHLRDVQPEPGTYTVPTQRMRQGDFSEWADLVYDPLTATGGNNQRTPFPGNVIPANRINPVAANFVKYYPEPNQPGLEDNYFSNQLRPYDYNAVLGRIDHNFGANHRLFLSGYWNKRQEDRYDWAGVVNNFAVTRGFDYRSNTGMAVGFTSTFSSNLLLDVRGGYSRFGEWRQPAQEFDPASLGFSSTAVGLMGDYKYLPLITFSNFNAGTNANSRIATLGSQRSDYGQGFDRPFDNISFAPTVTYLWRDHSFRAGYELRYRRWNITSAGYGAGRYDFTGAYTRANNGAGTGVVPQMFAQFLLGLPTTSTNTVASPGASSSQFEIAADGDYRQTSHGVFLQDDWRVTRKLTLNLGVRLEVEHAMTEAENRNLAGFDAVSASPIEAAALKAYAANPIPEIPVGQFAVKGGVLFADGPIYNTLVKFLPRAAASYSIDDKTVLRAGIGRFSYPYYFDAGNQSGFSQPTGVITTTNNGATFLTDLTNPVPGGALITPPGSSLGLGTSLGLTLGTVIPVERKTPYYTRWQVGVQRDLGAGWVAELTYVGSRGRDLPVVSDLNGIPFSYLSTSRTRDTANESYLSAQVPNPFRGLLPGTSLNGATITRGQLLRLYPQFLGGSNNGTLLNAQGNIGVGGTGSVGTEEYTGSDLYDAGSIRIEKRFSNGNSLLATYTRSRARDKLGYLNPSDPNAQLEDRVSPNDRPNRVSVGATFAFPFGHGRKWGSDWSGALDAILGGWWMSGTYQYQTGFPLTWTGNIYYDPTRNPLDLKSNIGEKTDRGIAGLDYPAWDTSGFYIAGGTGASDARINVGNNVRYFPSTLPDVRTHDLHLMDVGLYKDFNLPRDVVLQVRIEAINALNYTVLWNPTVNPRQASFGLVTQDRNNPRDIQLAVRLTF